MPPFVMTSRPGTDVSIFLIMESVRSRTCEGGR
jgi:hypothetical protein